MKESEVKPILPTDAAERKGIPLATGVLDYFPLALAEIAKLSKAGNDQHNPGEPLHWARGKSMDHADTAMRHLVDRGTIDKDGQRHSAKAAWRMLALLQEEMEQALGAPLPRGAKVEGATPDKSVLDEYTPPGWVCRRCKSTELWHGYAPGEVIAEAHPQCDTDDCYAGMERVR